MTVLRLTLLLVMALVPMLVRADDATDAKAIVDKGIKAAGWDKLKTTNQTFHEKGKMAFLGQTMDYEADWVLAPPLKFSFDMKTKLMDQAVEMSFQMNGDKAWESAAGQSREVTGEKLKQQMESCYVFNVTALTPLLKEKAYTLKTVPGVEVNTKPTVGVTVTADGKPTITLYFDKASGLMVRMDRQMKDEFQNWKLVNEETYYQDYLAEKEGVMKFMKLKLIRDGKPLIESIFSDHQHPMTLDDKLFEKR